MSYSDVSPAGVHSEPEHLTLPVQGALLVERSCPDSARAEVTLPSTFMNPIATGADPCVVWHDGYYYWCASENDAGVSLYRSEQLVFHAKLERAPNWKRAVHVQPFRWTADGAPVFGDPIAAGRPLACPRGNSQPILWPTVARENFRLNRAVG